MLDETVLTTMLERKELIYAKNSWLSGKNVERAAEIGITPKKRAYIRKNAPWSKARGYKRALRLKQRVRNILFRAAVVGAREILGVNDPVKAVRLAFGEAKPKVPVSRAKPLSALKAEIEDEISKLPREMQEEVRKAIEAMRDRLAAYKAFRPGEG